MKIIFICLASIFTEGMTYQDNLLANQVREDGNEVVIIADAFKYVNGNVTSTEEVDFILDNGIRLIRKKYKKILGQFISSKIRAVRGLYSILEVEKPDIIFHHSLHTYEMLIIKKYIRNHPEVRFFVDSHEDYYNTARNFFSKYILHKIYYRFIIKRSLPVISKVFYVSYESRDFLKEMYSIKENHMEFYPLGGITFNEQIRKNKYNVLRNKLGLKSDDMIVLHSGKLDRTKKTLELIDAFNKIKNSKMYLVIIGSLNNDIRDIFNSKIINNEKIKYLGWKKGDELLDYLCACDLYVQPGTQSATLQNAACCCCAIATYPYPNYQLMFKDSIFYISDSNEIYELFLSISKKPKLVFEQATKSYDIALRMLDYKVLANRIYNK